MTDEVQPSKADILTGAIAQRQQEITLYDINIDNYTRAVADIAATYTGDDAVSVAMRAQHDKLTQMLGTEQIEREKSAVILRALQAQLAALTPAS